MPERKTPRKSPSKPRILNRWDDDLDKGVLLCVQYACSEAGLKIPWARVAEIMGPSFTEGGIVQHLAKLRNLMITAEIPVPPTIKRGTITKSPSKIYGSAANPRVKHEAIAPLFPNGTSSPRIKQEDDGEQPLSIYERAKRVTDKLKDIPAETTEKKGASELKPSEERIGSPVKSATKPKSKGKAKNKGRGGDISDEEGEVPDLYDSDPSYSSPRKRRRLTARSKTSTTTAKAVAPILPSPATTPLDGSEEDGVKIKVEEEESGPATRTRGLKRDYSMMADPSSDEIEPEFEQQEQIAAADLGANEQKQAAGAALESTELEQIIESAVYSDDDDAAHHQVDQAADEADDHSVEEGVEDVEESEKEADEDADDEVDEVDSEAETEVMDHGDAATADAQGYDQFSQPAQVVNTSYGQVFAHPGMVASPQVMSGFGHRFDGAGGVHNFDPVDYMAPSFTGNMSVQYPLSGIASMAFPPGRNIFANYSSMAMGNMFAQSAETSQNSSQAGLAGYANMMPMPSGNFMELPALGDVINEQDHVDSMPNGDIFFTQDGDYHVRQ